MNILILGGGASGLIAAIEAARVTGCRVTLLERQARVARKLLATGNGRCNLTNTDLSAAHFHGADAAFAQRVLQRFGLEDTLAFFSGLGLLTVTEPGGRVYPFSDSANSVADVLRLTAEQLGVQLITGAEVRAVSRSRGGFSAETEEMSCRADRLIVACGGAAGAKLGGGVGGYRLLETFGHRRTRLYPSLVQLRADDRCTRALKGVRADAEITLCDGAHVLAHSAGEVQFTEYGVSGPAAFEISRTAAQYTGRAQLRLDLARTLPQARLLDMLLQRAAAFPDLTAENLLTGMLHNRLGRTVVQRCQLAFETPLGTLTQPELARAAAAVKCFSLPFAGTLGFESAQVTAGGIETAGFDPNTMQSRLVPGLYACGEVLDVDGDCGGYNLQWAWSSGRLAGRSAGGAV